MPEETITNNGAPAGTPAPTTTPQGNDPAKPENGGQTTNNGTVDLKSLTPEQLAPVLENPNFWNLDRIAKLREKASKADTFESEKKAQEEEALKKKGEFEALATKATQERDEYKSKYEKSVVDNQITIAAQKAGAVDVPAVLQLIDRSGIKLNDDGTVAGIDEAVNSLITGKPYLKGNGTTPTVGSPSNPNPSEGQPTKKFKSSQLKDYNFYKANEKEIDYAVAHGLIEVDD